MRNNRNKLLTMLGNLSMTFLSAMAASAGSMIWNEYIRPKYFAKCLRVEEDTRRIGFGPRC